MSPRDPRLLEPRVELLDQVGGALASLSMAWIWARIWRIRVLSPSCSVCRPVAVSTSGVRSWVV
jgi:hypothetical protein